MILVTAGAPRFCRAEYEGWRSVRVAVVRSVFGVWLSQVYARLRFGGMFRFGAVFCLAFPN